MIRMPRPNMALNGIDVFQYTMGNIRSVASDVTPYWLANNTAAVAANAVPRLAALVINCHGFVDAKGIFQALDLGTGLWFADLRHFRQLRNLVESIYITSCRAAAGATGRRFCGELARQTQAFVYAGELDQRVGLSSVQALFRGDLIDDYEGQVYRFGHSGQAEAVVLESAQGGLTAQPGGAPE